MTDRCPHLEYRPLSGTDREASAESGEDDAAAEPRAYCTAAAEFIQPMRADICNDRYDLDYATDCEIFREYEGLSEVPDEESERAEGSP